MFVTKSNKRLNLLRVDDDFASLVDIKQNGDLIFQFHYSFSQTDALKNNARSIEIIVYHGNVSIGKTLDSKKSDGEVEKELMKSSSMLDASRDKAKSAIGKAVEDILSKVSNEDASRIASGVKKSSVKSFNKTKITCSRAGEVKRKGQSVLKSGSTLSNPEKRDGVDVKSSTMKMILNRGIDPSDVVKTSHQSLTSYDVFSGFRKITRMNSSDDDDITKLRDSLVSPSLQISRDSDSTSDNELLHVIQSVVDDSSNISTTIVIPAVRSSNAGPIVRGKILSVGTRSTSLYTVCFSVLDSSGTIIDSVTKTFDTSAHVTIFNTPKEPPTVRVCPGSVSSKSNLSITQVDNRAQRVNVYRKFVSSSDFSIDPYEYVGTYDLTRGRTVLVDADAPISSCVIYRVIPVSFDGTMSYEFSNVVIRPTKVTSQNFAAVTAIPFLDGIKISVNNLPTGVVAVRVVGRNSSTLSDWLTVGSTVSIKDPSIDEVVVTDEEVSPDNVYEYVADIVMRDGTVKRTGHSIVEFIPFNRGYVNVSIEGLTVTDALSSDSRLTDYIGRKVVSFTIKGVVSDKEHDSLKKMLIAQNLYEHYSDSMTEEREKLASVISYGVKRIDTLTGEVVDFGIVSSETFNESDYLEEKSSQPMIVGRKYRYEVTPMIREPETMFETIVKTSVDKLTMKKYSYSPAKFMHPLSLRTGTVTSESTRSCRHAKSSMSFGKLGQTVSVDVDLSEPTLNIVNVRVTRFDRTTNVLTWQLTSSFELVDHFLILKDIQGVITIVGKVHSTLSRGQYTYVHQLTSRDSGSIRYRIIPVFNTYSRGAEYVTSSVFVDPEDVDPKSGVAKSSIISKTNSSNLLESPYVNRVAK